jgi:general secretion pathway protein G
MFPGQQNPSGYDLISYGADGKPGGEGDDADIASWK